MDTTARLVPELKTDSRGRSLTFDAEVNTSSTQGPIAQFTGGNTALRDLRNSKEVPPADALIIGLTVGCVCAFLLAIVIVYACIRRAKLKKKTKQCQNTNSVPQLVIEHAADQQTSTVPSGGRAIPGSRHFDGTESEYGSVRGTPPPSPTPSWKSAVSTISLSRNRPGSFDTCYSLSSSYGSARSYVSRKSRATLASFKSARSAMNE